MRARFFLPGVAALVLLGAAPLGAQSVTGRVTAAESGAPLAGAFVRLLDESGAQRRAVLTDELGRYRLTAPGPGRYVVRAEFIGRTDAVMGEVALREELTVDWSPALAPRPLTLRGLDVRGARRCGVPAGEGTAVAALWQEARKALEVAAWAAEEQLFQYEIRTHRRELDVQRRSVVDEQVRRRSGFFDAPFVSRPPAELMSEGFVQEREGGTFAYAPDARVLLDDAFLAGHCFRLVEGGGRVGLAFEPVPGRQRPDIRGVMWLDRETAALESVDYRYVRFPGAGPDLELGGHVAFERLPTGAWIVQDWAVQMPIWAEMPRAGRTDVWDRVLAGVMEEGGEVLRVVDRDGRPVLEADRATLYGAVFDSVRSRPLADALVVLQGTDRTVRTEDDGTFYLSDLPGGRFDLVVRHPRLDSLGLTVREHSVELAPGRSTGVRFALPRSEATGRVPQLQGEVLEAEGRAPVPNAVARLVQRGGGVVAVDTTGSRGDYRATAPAAGEYRVQVEVPGVGILDSDWFVLPDSTRTLHSLRFDTARAAFRATAPASEALRVGGGESMEAEESSRVRLVGRVVSRESGRPLAGASVRVGARPPVLSDSLGRFQTVVDPGRHPVEVEGLGRETLRDTLDARGSGVIGVRIELAEEAIELDPLMVEVEARSPILERAGFYDRRDRSGISGWRLTREEIEEEPPARLSDLVDAVPGTFLMYPGYPAGGALLRMNRSGNRFRALEPDRPLPGCEPTVYLDGLEYFDSPTEYPRLRNLNFISPSSIEAIEVYTGLTAPAQFNPRGCGVVLIWTRGG